MDPTRFDRITRALAAPASRRATLRAVAAGAAGALGLAAGGGALADRRHVDQCVRQCPNLCDKYIGDDYTDCMGGCNTCCWQGIFDEGRTATCMAAMIACTEAPNCPAPAGATASADAPPLTVGP